MLKESNNTYIQKRRFHEMRNFNDRIVDPFQTFLQS
jgi:hypothetical protein